MRVLWVSVAVAIFVLLAAGVQADCGPNWRLAGSFDYLTASKASDLLGNAWNVGLEYDFTDFIPDDEAMGGNISMAVHYRRFDNSDTGYSMNYTSFGLRWRKGPGADPGCEGFYGGIGVAAALLSNRPSLNLVDPNQTLTKLEVGAFVGANLGRYLYIETGYNNLNSVNNFNLGNATIVLGIRL